MSMAFIYNIFDGCELLEASLTNAKNNNVDTNIVVYQEISYYGNKIVDYDINEVIHYLEKKKLIDKSIKYTPSKICSNSYQAKQMESLKYTIGLSYVKEQKIDYFAPRAADEFFIREEFIDAVNFMMNENYLRLFCSIKTYSDIDKQDIKPTDSVNSVVLYKTIYPDDLILGKFEECYGRYIGKNYTKPKWLIDNVVGYGVLRDYFSKTLYMHHYRLTRLNLITKIQNSSIQNKNFLKSQINNIEKIKKNTNISKNIFDIDIEKFKRLFVKDIVL
jgi:hypothetical protein